MKTDQEFVAGPNYNGAVARNIQPRREEEGLTNVFSGTFFGGSAGPSSGFFVTSSEESLEGGLTCPDGSQTYLCPLAAPFDEAPIFEQKRD